MSTTPIISLKKLRREFIAGDETIVALNDIDLDIMRGEMVAIVGSSGSGKSTMMNVLGCLDQGFSGEYLFDGRDIRKFGVDELAELRREHFGFIFQRYQLLADLDAVENVELPGVYAGVKGGARRSRARELLTQLGLRDRMSHRPNAMSGGQQQRVSVARALMNGGEVIFADEPTGALDSHTGAELLALLHQLNDEGHTIIVVTHEKALAESLPRQIEISDGQIIADTRNTDVASEQPQRPSRLKRNWGWIDTVSRVAQAFAIAWRAMASHKLRTFLTMLGIIIGIASVVSVVGLGQGSQEQVLSRINAMGTNTINVFSGQGFRDRGGPRVETLTANDAKAIAALDIADSVTPRVSSSGTALYRNVSGSVQMNGVGDQYFRVSGLEFIDGVSFDDKSVETLAQEVVIDTTTRDTFFVNGEDPVGEVLLVGQMPLRIIGVVKASTSGGFASNQLNIYAPYTTIMSRVLGQSFLSNITVRVKDDASMDDAEAQISAPAARPSRHPGFHADEHRHHPRDHRIDDPDADPVHFGDRADLADRGRHRRDEHHARFGDRAHTRDRRAPRHRRAARRHHAPIPDRGRHGLHDRWRYRCRVVAGHFHHRADGVHQHCRAVLATHRGAGFRLLNPDRRGLRLHAGALRRPARSCRGPRLRISGKSKTPAAMSRRGFL